MQRLLILLLLTPYNIMLGQDLEAIQIAYFEDFKATFKHEHFEIGNMTMRHRSGKGGFEIEIIPQKEGKYFIKQIFTYEDGWGYKNNSILNVIKVGRRGTPRVFNGKQPNSAYSYTCWVGDTIVIPVYWSSHVIANEFSTGDQKERDIWGALDLNKPVWKQKERQMDWEITNHVDELKVIGVYTSYAIHRHLRDESVGHQIQFEAIHPGKFTLKIGDATLPVIIVSHDQSIRKYVTQAVGHQWEERVTSTGLPLDYMNEPKHALLRVGDQISLTFNSYVQSVEDPLPQDLKLAVTKKRFKD